MLLIKDTECNALHDIIHIFEKLHLKLLDGLVS